MGIGQDRRKYKPTFLGMFGDDVLDVVWGVFSKYFPEALGAF